MSQDAGQPTQGDPVQAGEVVRPNAVTQQQAREEESQLELIEHPAKLMRIAAMARHLLEEARQAPLDESGRRRLKEIYELSVGELGAALSPDLREELRRVTPPFSGDTPSQAELRVAQAQLVGWLEGLFHGIQATLFAQQMAARSQLEELRRRSLPQAQGGQPQPERPGTYL
jgi:hypothetical protein